MQGNRSGRGSLGILLAAVLALVVALACVGVAAAKFEKVRVGSLIVEFDGGFSPKKISRTKPTPIKFLLAAKIRDVEGKHPPALKEFNVETDKNGAVTTKGYPACPPSKLQATTSAKALAVCRKALIGEGKTTVEIEFADSSPVMVNSDLLLFNGGTKGGKTTFLVHAYITVPTPAAIVTTVKIRKVKRGRYGTEAISRIPKIAGGAGSVRSFNLSIFKTYRYKGRKVSVLTLKCPDGKVQARGEAVFTDGTKARAEILRRCTPKR